MNNFQITRRQALLLFIICTISSKLQMLPCLVSADVGKSLWVVLLLGCSLDAVLFGVVIIINKIVPNMTLHDIIRQTFGKFISWIVGLLLLIYYICTAVLPYEAVRDVFSSNLFDTLPWQLYSVFLLVAVGYLAFSGLRTIGRTAELYCWVIFFCVAGLILLGAVTANYINIFPLGGSDFSAIIKSTYNHSIWFGDYMIFFVLIGRIKPGKTGLKFYDLGIYAGCILIYAFAFMTFYSLYTVLASMQSSLLSGISTFSLLTLDIGRVDWFLVLLSQIASIISCATYTYCATDCVNQLTGKKNYILCLLFTLAVLYVTDIFLFANIDIGLTILKQFTAPIGLSVQILLPILALISAICYKKRKIGHQKGELAC